MKRNSVRLTLALMAVTPALASVTRADHDEIRALQQAGHIMAFERIQETVSRLHANARILEVELEHKRGRYIYEIEVLGAGGVVYEVKVDAASGHILANERD